jgi:hypothetical protein
MQKFTDAASLGGARVTADGYLVADVRCARTGCQTYLASEIGLADSGTITVYRSENVVFDKASMATFAGKPVTLGHPANPVTADNWKDHAVGDIGEDVARDGEFIRVPIKLMDAAAIDAVQAGTREISMGYTCGLEMKDGVAPDGTAYQAVQTGPIRINHLAIVPKARGGSNLRIGDSADHWGASPVTTSDERITKVTDNALKTVVLGDKAVQVAVADVAAIEAFKADSAKALADTKAAHDAAMAVKDADLAKKDAKIADLEKAALSDADLDKKVQARADLIARVGKVAKDVATAGLSDAAIKRAAVVKVRGAEMSDKSDAYIDAAFDLLSDGADPLQKPLADTAKAGTAHAEYTQRLGDAWKTKEAK